jgi:hypothetical protein
MMLKKVILAAAAAVSLAAVAPVAVANSSSSCTIYGSGSCPSNNPDPTIYWSPQPGMNCQAAGSIFGWTYYTCTPRFGG